MAEPAETYTFSTDIAQLMGIIINTVYCNKEIFLRELVSNASDALERARCGTGPAPARDAYIRVVPDRASRTLTVEDSGIGMTREELVEILGTIAQSKTKAFMEAAAASGADPTLIGQFGIGFYSAYVVSERICVVSKSESSDVQYVWESSAGGTFSVRPDEALEHGTMQRGTKVVCYLKEDRLEFLEPAYLRELLARHSCFVGWPLYVSMERLGDQLSASPAVPSVVHYWDRINRIRPVWLDAAAAVSASDYAEVYRWLTGTVSQPLAVRHLERPDGGQVDFRALLFCSRTAPEDLFDLVEGRTQGAKVRLYVRRVFVKEFHDLLPKWMCFVKGVVDSDDLPLNISREHLQKESAVMRHMSRVLVKECFEMLGALAANESEFKVFQDAFGQNLKLGLCEDVEARPRITELLRYYTTMSEGRAISLREYVARMKPEQKHILYVTGRSRQHAAQSPLIEGFRRDAYEVLLMGDPADEFALPYLKEFGGREFVSATSAHAGVSAAIRPRQVVLEPLRVRIEELLQASGRTARVLFKEQGVGSPLPAAVEVDEAGKVLILNASHGLYCELSKRRRLNAMEQELVLLLFDLAAALRPDVGAQASELRRRLGERLLGISRRLDGGSRDAEEEDWPSWAAGAAAAGCGAPLAKERWDSWRHSAPERGDALSVGSIVRVLGERRSRRSMVTFVDSRAGTVDVLYSPLLGRDSGAEEEEAVEHAEDEEEEAVPLSSVSPLLDFEKDQGGGQTAELARAFAEDFEAAAMRVKEEGNALFMLRDFDAAHERYTLIIDAARRRPLDVGQVVLLGHVVEAAKQRLRPAVVRRVLGRAGARDCELDDGRRVSESVLLPVLGISSLKPLLEQVAAFRRFAEPVLEQIATCAADSALLQVSLQASAYMNRARCGLAVSRHRAAGRDLSTAMGLWSCLTGCHPHTDSAAKQVVVKGLCTAQYLRARSRLSRGLASAAAADVQEALARDPPPAVARQLEELWVEVCTALAQRQRVREPLASEVAKVIFALRFACL